MNGMVRSKRIAFNFTLEIEINTQFISTKENRNQALCEVLDSQETYLNSDFSFLSPTSSFQK